MDKEIHTLNGVNGYNHHIPYPHNGTLPPLKGGLSSLADDMHLNGKIGNGMDLDITGNGKIHQDYHLSNGNTILDKEKMMDDDRQSIMGIEDQVIQKLLRYLNRRKVTSTHFSAS